MQAAPEARGRSGRREELDDHGPVHAVKGMPDLGEYRMRLTRQLVDEQTP